MTTNTYAFSYNSATNEDLPQYPVQTHLNKVVSLDQDATWMMALREFLDFLSCIYGYDIKGKVFLQDFSSWDGEANFVPVSDYE